MKNIKGTNTDRHIYYVHFCYIQSSIISRVVYTIAWYDLPVSFKMEIYLLMLRSQKPSKITAGKFYIMHLENFNAVIHSFQCFIKMFYYK